MNLEERVVAAEVASRRADGPGVIEVQSQLRSDVAGQGLGPGTQWRGRPVRPSSSLSTFCTIMHSRALCEGPRSARSS